MAPVTPGDVVGLLPAGGLGTRLPSLQYPKELLPVGYRPVADGSDARPRIICEFALEGLATAGVRRCVIVVAPWKLELVRALGGGQEFGLEFAYVYQDVARGLPHAVDLAYPWIADREVAFAMPDTLFRPRNSLARVGALARQSGADLTLGLFPSNQPEQLGPVLLKGSRVTRVLDKVPDPPTNMVWGIAWWGPRFTQLLHDRLEQSPPDGPEPVLGSYFQMAIDEGLRVHGVAFPEGTYLDMGTPEGIRACTEWWRSAPDSD